MAKDITSDVSYRQLEGYETPPYHAPIEKCGFSSSRKSRCYSGDACCKMNETVNVSMTPKRASKERLLIRKENVEGSGNISDSRQRQHDNTDDSDNVARSIYLGVCNFSKAEEMVEKRADFRLYHEMIQNPLLDDLEPELPLYLVYKTANGSYRHYPVRTRSVYDSIYYYVETGEKRPVHHCDLNHLVRYYQINAQRHPEHHEYADPFPWWEVAS